MGTISNEFSSLQASIKDPELIISKKMAKVKENIEELKRYYKTRNPSKFIEIMGEYKKLQESFEEAKKSNGRVTKEELRELLVDLDNVNSVIEKNRKLDSKIIYNFKHKNINDLKGEELNFALSYLNQNYSKYDGSFLAKAKTFLNDDETNILSLDSQREVNIVQEELIRRKGINTKGYSNDGGLHAYYAKMGNYITNVTIVELAIKEKGFQKLGSKAISSYLNYLEGTGKLKPQYLRTLGKNNIKELFKYYNDHKNEDDFKNVSSSIYSTLNSISNTLEDVKDVVVEKASEVFKNIDNFVDNLFGEIKDSKDLTKVVNSIDKFKTKEEKNYYIQALKRNIEENRNQLRYMFLREIKIKGLSDKEKNKRVDELIKALSANLSVSKLPEYKKLIENFNKDNGGNASAKESSGLLSNIRKRKNKIEKIVLEENINELIKKLGEAEKKGDKKTIAVLKAELMAKKTGLVLIAKSDNSLRGFEKVTSKIDIDKTDSSQIEQKIVDLRKTDKEFDAELKKEEAIQKKLDSEIKKYEQEIKPEADKKDKSEKVNKESEKNNNTQKEIYEGKTYNVIKNESGDTTAYTGIIGTKQISIFASELTGKEKEDLENNPEKIKNFVEFKSFLEETGLGFLWKYRDKLKNKLAEKNNFYDYEDGLSIKEQLDLLNFIGDKLGFTKIEDLVSLKEKFEQKSKLSVFDANGKKYENNSDKNIFEQALEGKLIDKGKWIE